MSTFNELFKQFLLDEANCKLTKLNKLKKQPITNITPLEQIQNEIKELEFELKTLGTIGQILITTEEK